MRRLSHRSGGRISGHSGIGDCRTRVCAEQLGNLILDARNDLAVEERNHRGNKQRAEDYGDDDFDTFGETLPQILCKRKKYDII